jgi:hypothetical protein
VIGTDGNKMPSVLFFTGGTKKDAIPFKDSIPFNDQ